MAPAALDDLVDLVCDEAMCLEVHSNCTVRVGRLDEAEHGEQTARVADDRPQSPTGVPEALLVEVLGRRVGYVSEEAFRRSFERAHGQAPSV